MKIILNDGRQLMASLTTEHPLSCFAIPVVVGEDGAAYSKAEVKEVVSATQDEKEQLAMAGYLSPWATFEAAPQRASDAPGTWSAAPSETPGVARSDGHPFS